MLRFQNKVFVLLWVCPQRLNLCFTLLCVEDVWRLVVRWAVPTPWVQKEVGYRLTE